MRLRTALEASALVGKPVLYWFDRTEARWVPEPDLSVVGRSAPAIIKGEPSTTGRLKRSLFPSTLYESGRAPIHAFAGAKIPPASTVVLHTSYLAPLVKRVRVAGAQRIVVDVHDVVFGAHTDDAGRGPLPIRALRRLYAETVRYRERRALSRADALAVAGWGDVLKLKSLAVNFLTWTPTGIDTTISASPATPEIRVGLIGNFAHSATADAANTLLESKLGTSDECRLVFAGLHSEQALRANERAKVLGPVENISTFYESVHAVVVPVRNGSGMKCKLGEAVMAGKAVITTPLGAEGYSPELQSAFVVVDSTQHLSMQVVTSAIEHLSHEETRGRFESTVGRTAAAHTYAHLLECTDQYRASGRLRPRV